MLSACAAPPDPAVAAGRAELARYVASEFRADAPGGVVLVARGAEPLVHGAFGLADVSTGRAMGLDDALPIGSITKSFTAGAILRLVDEGRLRLDDDPLKWVPAVPLGDERVSIEQLLTHTSGMPNLVDRDDFEEWATKARTTAELVEATRGMAWLAKPGTEFHYSDSGYILLGAVIEAITGMPYGEYVSGEIAAPLGLHSVRSAHPPLPGDPVGTSGGQPADGLHRSVPHASGGLVASVADLHRWVVAWEQGDVVPLELAQLAWTPRTLPGGTRSSYGFGWKFHTFTGTDSVGHGGWVPGFSAGLVHLPEVGLTAVALTNSDDGRPEASYVARRALRLLRTGSPFVQVQSLTDARRAQLAGRYLSLDGLALEVEAPTGTSTVLASFGGDEPFELIALSPEVLAAADSDGTWCFTFEGAEGGPARQVQTSLSGEPGWTLQRVVHAKGDE